MGGIFLYIQFGDNMKDVFLPDKIKEIIGDRKFLLDGIGMSDSSVLIFDDMVLKIQPCSKWTENEHVMINWLKNKVLAPEPPLPVALFCRHFL